MQNLGCFTLRLNERRIRLVSFKYFGNTFNEIIGLEKVFNFSVGILKFSKGKSNQRFQGKEEREVS